MLDINLYHNNGGVRQVDAVFGIRELECGSGGWCDETQRPQPAGFMINIVIKLIKHDICLFNSICIMLDCAGNELLSVQITTGTNSKHENRS